MHACVHRAFLAFSLSCEHCHARDVRLAEKKQPEPAKEPTVNLQVRLPQSLHQRLRKMNFETNQSLQAFAVEAVAQHLKDRGF